MRQNISYLILIFLIVSYVNGACDCSNLCNRSNSFANNKISFGGASITSSEYKDDPLATNMIDLQVSSEYKDDSLSVSPAELLTPSNVMPIVNLDDVSKDSFSLSPAISPEYKYDSPSMNTSELQMPTRLPSILKYPEHASKIAQVWRERQSRTLQLAPSPEDLNVILDIMWETLYNFNLKFLSADQIGISEFIVVMDLNASRNRFLPPNIRDKKIVMISPQIISSSSEEWMQVTETCASVPGVRRTIQLPKVILVSFFSEKYTPHVISAEEELSQIIQHAVDHLNQNKCVIDLPGSRNS